MFVDLDVYGVYVPWLLALMLVALILIFVLRRVLSWVGIYELVWHRGLFDVALYVVLLAILSFLTQGAS